MALFHVVKCCCEVPIAGHASQVLPRQDRRGVERDQALCGSGDQQAGGLITSANGAPGWLAPWPRWHLLLKCDNRPKLGYAYQHHDTQTFRQNDRNHEMLLTFLHDYAHHWTGFQISQYEHHAVCQTG